MKELFSNDELPKDYGGDGPTLEDLNGKQKQVLIGTQSLFGCRNDQGEVVAVPRPV